MTNTPQIMDVLKRARPKALTIGVIGIAACFAFGLRSRETAMQAYLLAYLYWLAIALGSLSLLMLQYVTGGRWGLTIRRLLEAASGTLPAMLVLFIPILLHLRILFPWADPTLVAGDEILLKKVAYLNPGAFTIRALVYFAIWIVISRLLIRWSRRQDDNADPALERRLRRLSAPGLVLYSLSVTFASFDWAMSLEPHWFSTIYGVLYGAGAAVAAMTFATVVLSRLAPRGPHAAFLKPETVGDLGNLTLAFTMFWTYISLSQFLIIWSGHLPEETPWYFVRMHGGWGVVGAGLFILNFALPFLFLLSRATKRNLNKMGRLALYILIVRFMDLLWIVAPAFSPDAFRLGLPELAAMAGIGGLWIFTYTHALAAAPILPARLAGADMEDNHHG